MFKLAGQLSYVNSGQHMEARKKFADSYSKNGRNTELAT